VLAACAALIACAARAPQPPAPSRSSCAAFESAPPAERICREDGGIETLQARFRADVTIGDESRSSEGVLLVRRPGALRVKLFGIGGMTVHDALWVAEGSSVRGVVRRPFDGEPLVLELRPGERPTEPEAGLSFALWALWRERCARTPRAGADGWLDLDPASAHAAVRQVRVGATGVEAERVVWQEGAPASEVIRVHYAVRDCSLALPLPTSIEMVASPQGWRASVRILEQKLNLELDENLFVTSEGAPPPHPGRGKAATSPLLRSLSARPRASRAESSPPSLRRRKLARRARGRAK